LVLVWTVILHKNVTLLEELMYYIVLHNKQHKFHKQIN